MSERYNLHNDVSLRVMNGFYQLVQELDFTKLTVLEICNAVNISRKTFYKKFKDKNDIIEQILIRDVFLPMEKLRELYSNMDLPKGMILEWQYDQFYKNRNFYRCISSFTGQNSFSELIVKYSSSIIEKN